MSLTMKSVGLRDIIAQGKTLGNVSAASRQNSAPIN